MVGLGKGGVDRRLVAQLEKEAFIVGTVLPDRRGIRLDGIRGRGYGRQGLVIDLDQLGGVLGLRQPSRC